MPGGLYIFTPMPSTGQQVFVSCWKPAILCPVLLESLLGRVNVGEEVQNLHEERRLNTILSFSFWPCCSNRHSKILPALSIIAERPFRSDLLCITLCSRLTNGAGIEHKVHTQNLVGHEAEPMLKLPSRLHAASNKESGSMQVKTKVWGSCMSLFLFIENMSDFEAYCRPSKEPLERVRGFRFWATSCKTSKTWWGSHKLQDLKYFLLLLKDWTKQRSEFLLSTLSEVE